MYSYDRQWKKEISDSMGIQNKPADYEVTKLSTMPTKWQKGVS